MKRISCDYSKLDFSSSSLIRDYQFKDGILSIFVRFFGAQIGEGEDIQYFDIPDGTLIFRKVSYCKRKIGDYLGNNQEFRVLSIEKENLPEVPNDPNPVYPLFAQSAAPEGMVEWDVRAEGFELEVEDETYERLKKAGFFD